MMTNRWIRRSLGLMAVALFVIVVLFPQVIWSKNPNAIEPRNALKGPSWTHPFGTDEAGSDVLARLLDAVSMELWIAGGSVMLGLLIAVPLGLIAGYFGSFLDEALSAVGNSILAFPLILLAVLVVASFGPSATTLVLVLGLGFIPYFFGIVRDQANSIRGRTFVMAARVNGASTLRILLSHILPNVSGPLSVMIPQMLAMAILVEAGLSYLGLGVQPPAISWGTMLMKSSQYYLIAPWYVLAPGLCITAAAAAFMFSGDAVARRFDPRWRAAQRTARQGRAVNS